MDKLEQLILNNTSYNPRNMYFVKELLTILAYYKQVYPEFAVKRKIRN